MENIYGDIYKAHIAIYIKVQNCTYTIQAGTIGIYIYIYIYKCVYYIYTHMSVYITHIYMRVRVHIRICYIYILFTPHKDLAAVFIYSRNKTEAIKEEKLELDSI